MVSICPAFSAGQRSFPIIIPSRSFAPAGADFIEVSFRQPPSLADQNRIVIGFIIADE
jgi:hypothetical protein